MKPMTTDEDMIPNAVNAPAKANATMPPTNPAPTRKAHAAKMTTTKISRPGLKSSPSNGGGAGAFVPSASNGKTLKKSAAIANRISIDLVRLMVPNEQSLWYRGAYVVTKTL